MTLTTLQETQINNMNRASQKAQLGTIVKVLQDGGAGSTIPTQISDLETSVTALQDAYGTHTVSAGEETAGT